MKTIKEHGRLRLEKFDKPIFGGNYAVWNGDRVKTGLTLDAATEVYSILEKKIYGDQK